MKKKIVKTIDITGGILIFLLIVGAFANAYGADIKIWYITNLTPIIFIAVVLLVFMRKGKIK